MMIMIVKITLANYYYYIWFGFNWVHGSFGPVLQKA